MNQKCYGLVLMTGVTIAAVGAVGFARSAMRDRSRSTSNTMNYANVWIAPKRDFAFLVCVNQGGDAAFAASDEAIGALIGAFLKDPVEP